MTYTFDSFVAGGASKDALAAAIAVAHHRDRGPLVLLGPCGSGKSHLLHAIEGEMRAQRADANILHVSAQELADRVVAALRRDTLAAFESRLAALDALLVDDMRSLAGKPATEQEIAIQLQKLSARGVCVVVTSDRALAPPFAGAHVATLGFPDEAARVEIARRVAAEVGVPLPDHVLRRVSTLRSAPQLRSRILRLAVQARINP